ncbi:PDZ domain-containing protein [Bythopirellula goksoeyrii]|uniref:Periplasmic serine endoprotease DegP n=1 Tax=Bythopirellula goksoeyrii TaxID=1400387 RepID=A0A5B9QN73_9BACT|nr:PDZ domain-containing protein [Bythopirellula goksoeyrii]QEG35571.1 Periplasmic serine endoprotease DegP precursor [Bythopirellula goksoeyrii]
MQKNRLFPICIVALSLCLVSQTSILATEYKYALENAAAHQATAAVADSVVQIRTVGGLERVGKTQLSQGPLSGLIITADGYVVSSAFNFAQQPSSILVRLPSGKQVSANLVARDLNRMLVLLKVDSDEPLPVPEAVPTDEFAVGQWAIALGRTFQTDKVDVSLGIISALNRMHGRVVQTDANISAANYGGPLVDIHGRVFGVLVPMSPQSSDSGPENAVAGAEFYDSGIGFAVPLEHVYSMLDRWREGEDLLPGKLGIGLKSGSSYTEPPTITTVWPASPAAEAGWQPNDTIVAADGTAVETQSQLQFLLKPRYAGDSITFSLRRGSGETAEEFDSEITLAGQLAPYRHSFFGILPAADGKAEGIDVAKVWPNSPAEVAGVRAGDRITKIGSTAVPTAPAAWAAMLNLQPGETVEVSLQRGDQELSLQTKLSALPEEILSQSLLRTSSKSSTEEFKALEPQLLKLPEFPQEAHYLQPKLSDSQRPGLLIWLSSEKGDDEEAMFDAWQKVCQTNGIILLVARPGSETGWQSEDLEYLQQLVKLATIRFRPTPRQTILGGQQKGGQLAYALAFKDRRTFSGIIADNAPLPRTLQVPDNSPGGQLVVLSILPGNSTFATLVKHDNEQLRQEGYPVSQIERPAGTVLDDATIENIGRWIAGLNRF